ncbi:zinc finger DksA/TraR C4-type [Planctopirus limnophila DSM 3776]|jgi:DnaK suppressor protein|uniref:Zinc finger DksA/TraR C4-type n=3 Tax=Planctopirus TaxID=1649480 RepID=D5SUR4_PLAL2|nr:MULTISPECIES: TraR/DksA C4-type zinc finger protein [Planctopirus]ADG67116.1 zinc finger DksA/TraR C4-type [Planctopirus limnophila DSM 3776]ODA28610.1 hypothetical protein A6X21_13055 [Planctopirus hydrillae]QDV30012.1 General stress protein 16O [Planctopirus ephydatiae]
MSRNDAVAKIKKHLLLQREDLRSKIAEEMGLAYSPDDGINDLGETAALVEQSELHTQLAALETRELMQINRALALIEEGHYGVCQKCSKAIPLARLQAVPFTTVCVECQRRQEDLGDNDEDAYSVDWRKAYDHERRSNTAEYSVQDFDLASE